MVAFLRGHAVDTVYVGATDPAAVSSLLALGFHRAAEAGCFVLVLQTSPPVINAAANRVQAPCKLPASRCSCHARSGQHPRR